MFILQVSLVRAGRVDLHKPVSLLEKQPHAVSQPSSPSLLWGEHSLIAVTDMQIQFTWIMSVQHADAPSSTCWDMADMCNWTHFLFFLGFIHLKVRLGDRVDRWARVNADQSILGLVSTAQDTGRLSFPSLFSEGVSLGGVPSGLCCIHSNVVGAGGAQR